MAKKIRRISPVYLIPVLFFAGLWIFGETGMYNDSHQYIAMHIHREPLYPLFLWIFRTLLGENYYLEAVRFLQNLFSAFSVIWLTACFRRQFKLKPFMTFLVCALLLSPHVITPVFAASGLVLSNGIISEALVLPLFYLFTAQCMKLMFDRTKRAAFSALLLAVLLSLGRGQMMASILLWMVTAAAVIICEAVKKGRAGWLRRSYQRLLAIFLGVLLAFGSRTLLVKCYNLAFNGHFINNTYGSVSLLANVLYAADREDGEKIADEEAREFFYLSYDLADEAGANYRYAPDGFLNRAAHLEQWHDRLKFDMIEQPWRDCHDAAGFQDYILENVEQDRIAGIIIKSVLPAVSGRWIYDYLALAACGLIRSVAVVHPVLNWYALLAYSGVIALGIYTLRRNRNSRAVWAAAFSLLAVAANVYATSLVIMCLSRYVIYGLPIFYISALLLIAENAERLKKRKNVD